MPWNNQGGQGGGVARGAKAAAETAAVRGVKVAAVSLHKTLTR